MQGLGNDYVYLTCMDRLPDCMPALARDISDRHFGVGGDGMVVITSSDVADFRMIMFNADGSEAQMCGNASRCIARLVYEKGLTQKTEFTLETRAGIKKLKLNLRNGEIESISVNMGRPFLNPEDIPVVPSAERHSSPCPPVVHDVSLGAEEEKVKVHCIGMGNPHGVIFLEPDESFFQKYGPLLERHDIWPEKANIEFVKVVGSDSIEMRVWERGTGETLACGTGACASAVASALTGRTGREVTVKMKGGSLRIALDENDEVIMTGDACHIAQGIYFWNRKNESES